MLYTRIAFKVMAQKLSECERLGDMVLQTHNTAAGLAILIGNTHQRHQPASSTYQPILGPKKDIEHAKNVFSGCFGAACFVVEDKPAAEIKSIIKFAASSIDYPPSYKFIILMFSGHGREFDLIANDDRPINIENEVVKPFQPASSNGTARIPKLIFLDTCRGSEATQPVMVPRGGTPLETVYFPEKGNMLVAYSTLPKKQCYEIQGQGGTWINKVLTRLKSDDASVTDVLQNVNKDMLEQYDPKTYMQQPELKSTLLGAFKFNRVQQIAKSPTSTPPPAPRPAGRQVSRECPDIFTKKLNERKASGKIIKKEYVDLAGPGSHVDLTITFPNNDTFPFSSRKYCLEYDCINNAREKVAEKAVEFIDSMGFNSLSPVLERQQFSRSDSSVSPSGNPKESVQELKNFLVDKKGFTLNDDNFTFEESGENAGKKYKCTIHHEWFDHEISGNWRKSKKEARQSAAQKALEFCN